MALFEPKSNFYYEPKTNVGDKSKCLEMSEYQEFVKMIDRDSILSVSDKNFLKILATRFIVFKYEKLADLYASADSNMQQWLERLKCVIVDTDKAIANGYFEYMENYSMLVEDIVDE